MIQDLLNPTYENEYDIAYDKIYDDKTKILGKNNMRDTSIVTNERSDNGIGECMYGFYKHSKYFFILLFCVIAFLTGILYLISRIP